MDNLYTVVYDCDNGKNWERVPAAQLEDLIENLLAFGMKELYIFSPSGSKIDPDYSMKRRFVVKVQSEKNIIPPMHLVCEDFFTAHNLPFSEEKNETLHPKQHIYTVVAFDDFPEALRKHLCSHRYSSPVIITQGGEIV